ncbi:hypothetical protein MHBO_001820 [Bonamia ostreae]|uniref:EF-hand domain-containing protein n=1 Tax=Bonamia ostreae TaxID=126728 RepID=A0ABV2AK99_9EUKA
MFFRKWRTENFLKIFLKLPKFSLAAVPIAADEDWRQNIKRNYHNRIRSLSRPEKIFSTFASVTKDGEPVYVKYMTLDDFINSVVPFNCQSDHDKRNLRNEDYAAFFDSVDVDKDGLISLPEYALFSMLLSIPENNIETAFKMFDLDGNGRVEIDEFFNLIDVMSDKTWPGFSLRSIAKEAHLIKLFFGDKNEETLSFDRFKRFIVHLRRNINKMEFDYYDKSKSGFIDAKSFAFSITSYCSNNRIDHFIEKCKKIPIDLAKERISKDDFLMFNKVLSSLEEIRYALELFTSSQKALDKADFNRAVVTVTGEKLNKSVIDVIFYVFDEDGDGRLSQLELMKALEFRYKNKVEVWNEFGLKNRFDCVKSCL